MKVDPTTFELIRHKFFGVIDEAVVALKNVSGSPTTNEGHDLMVSLYRANGDLLLGGLGFLHHLTSASQACKHIINTYSDDPGIFEDDVFLLNDPYTAALHNSDLYMVAPIHSGGNLVAWTANFVHVTDIGAVDPGGLCPRATEIFQEGFRSSGLKLIERGKIRKDLFNTILSMVREPEIVALDLRSQIAGCNVAKTRMQHVVERYGQNTVDEVSQELIIQSERLLRQRLLEFPDGTWRARQHIDIRNELYVINLNMSKRGDELIFDFTGTSQQVPFGINCTRWATWGALHAPLLPLLCYDMAWNDGISRPLKLVAPKGTLVNCNKPAPVSLATVHSVDVINNLSTITISKMLITSKKYKNEATAVWHGSHAPVLLSGLDRDGEYFVETLTDDFAGSGGARAFNDGVDLGGQIANLVSRWANVETHELNAPIMYLFRRMSSDSGGPGKFRGGMCHEFAIRPHDASAAKVSCTLLGRGISAPNSCGLSGGYPGCNISYMLLDSESEDVLSKFNDDAESYLAVPFGTYELRNETTLCVRFMGGGGYGDPLERETNLVLRDYLDGAIRHDSSTKVYGVVIDLGRNLVDEEATRERRRTIRKSRLQNTRGFMPRFAEIKPNICLLNEQLAIIILEGKKLVQCLSCGCLICSTTSHWKDFMVVRESSLDSAGAHRPNTGSFFLKEFFCPGCATCVEVEVLHIGDMPLHDEILI